jgi:hypothetical protein
MFFLREVVQDSGDEARFTLLETTFTSSPRPRRIRFEEDMLIFFPDFRLNWV